VSQYRSGARANAIADRHSTASHPALMRITIDGTDHDVPLVGHETLLAVLRGRLGLTGTKVSCGRGECGACTVLLDTGGVRRPVYSCLTLAAACEGAAVTTIEGLADGDLHPLQRAFIEHDAVQCGFCTPGQILAAAALLEDNPSPSDDDIRHALSGNVCRCGTYPKIVAAVNDAARRMAHG
jgi:aerobic-type carbon monoxide dehydrogenase small subunit (CoxS/CutS family)